MIAIVGLQINNSLIADIIEFMNMKSRELYVVDLMIELYKKLTSVMQYIYINNI